MVNTIQVRSKGKDISYRSEPNVDPESTTETYASGAFFVDSDRFRGVPFFFRTGKRLTQKGTMVNVVSSKPTPSLDAACNQMSWPFISNQTKVSHWASTGKRSENIQHRTDFLWLRNRCDCNWSFPRALWKLILTFWTMTQPITATGTKFVLHGKLIDRIEKLWAENGAPLYEYKSGSMGPTASDDLLAEYGAEWVWNLNLRIKESHLRVVFDSAKETKDKLFFQQFVFSIRLLNQAFQEASHWSFLSGMVRCHQSFLRNQSTSLECPTLRGIARTTHLELFHRSWSIQFLSQA